jgi:hypothetical protein
MQAFNPLPDDQQLRSESSLPKFIRRINQQLDLYELSEYAHLKQADDKMPYASMADMSKRRQASALIKQSITDEVLDKFPDNFTGRQIIRAMELREHQTSTDPRHESKDYRGPINDSSKPMLPVSDKYTVASEGSFIASYSPRYETDYEMPVFRLPKYDPLQKLSRTLHQLPVATIVPSQVIHDSGVVDRNIEGSLLREEHRPESISLGFDCHVCSKPYQGRRQLQRHLLKHNNPNKFRCTIEV